MSSRLFLHLIFETSQYKKQVGILNGGFLLSARNHGSESMVTDSSWGCLLFFWVGGNWERGTLRPKVRDQRSSPYPQNCISSPDH